MKNVWRDVELSTRILRLLGSRPLTSVFSFVTIGQGSDRMDSFWFAQVWFAKYSVYYIDDKLIYQIRNPIKEIELNPKFPERLEYISPININIS